jgi:hypothetical protein
MIDNIAIPNSQNHSSIKPQTVMVDNKGIPNSQNHSFSQTSNSIHDTVQINILYCYSHYEL